VQYSNSATSSAKSGGNVNTNHSITLGGTGLLYKLSQLDPNLEVYCYEEGPVAIQGANPGPFDLVDVSHAPVLASRDSKTNKVNFKFEGNATGASQVAIIGITPDF
jgi:hypothetical protein